MKKGWRTTAACVVALALVACVALATQEKPLENGDVVKLTKLDMGEQVIIAKIRASRAVSFDTSTDALIALKEAGVAKPVIAAMIERSTAAAAPAVPKAATAEPAVTLFANGGSVELKAVYGQLKGKSSPFGFQQWVQFADATAKTRATDRRPSLLLSSDKDPRGGFWLVTMATYKDGGDIYRYFDLEGGGGPFSVTWSGSPEKGSVVKFEAVQEQPGLWRLSVPADLKPGEYGVFSGRNQGEGILFGFGVDK
jgi:hypothetical protein